MSANFHVVQSRLSQEIHIISGQVPALEEI